MRLIDGDKLMEELPKEYLGSTVHDLINSAPHIEIIRCGECKRHGTSLNDGCVYCTQLMWTMNPDDFCSYGERKGE